MNIVKTEILCTDAIKHKHTIVLPILDKKCLSFFFEEDDILFKDENFNKIVSVFFSYIDAREPNLYPVVDCKIKYNNLTSDVQSNYFIYDEFDFAESSNYYLERIKNYCEYVNGWLEINHLQAGGNLNFKQLFWFLEKVGLLNKYLVPKEDIVAYLDENYSIV